MKLSEKLLWGTTSILMFISIYLVFVYAPVEKSMGIVQKIFYFHVSSAWIGGLAFFVVFVCSIWGLIKQNRTSDILAQGSAEIGLLFTTIVLITGPIWAKPVWLTWWVWDARLTLTLVVWLIYLGYVMLRYYLPNNASKSNLLSVVAIIGFIAIPINYMAIRWWRTQHPSPVIGGGENSGLSPEMRTVFFTCLFTFTSLYLLLLNRRMVIEKTKDEVDYLFKLLNSR
ncbi:MAG: cytochrome C assembly protein [Calditrichaeota bacterium]|nr:MAG: cytochrome C assembly protein [Calditrichota bacterium]